MARYSHQPFWGSGGTLGVACIVAGCYFSFYACWLLGLIWRKYHKQFPWIAQRFTKEPEPAAQTRGPKAA